MPLLMICSANSSRSSWVVLSFSSSCRIFPEDIVFLIYVLSSLLCRADPVALMRWLVFLSGLLVPASSQSFFCVCDRF